MTSNKSALSPLLMIRTEKSLIPWLMIRKKLMLIKIRIKIPPLARTKVQKHLNETIRFSCSKSHQLSILKFRSPHISEPSDHLANLTRALLK